MRPWQRTRNQPQKPHQTSTTTEADPTSGSMLESCLEALEEGDNEALRTHVEAFKKMIFKMLNGKKKTVTAPDDEVEEAAGYTKVYSVQCPHNKKGHKPHDAAKVKKMLKGGDPDGRDADTNYVVSTPANKQGHKPVDPRAVKKMNKGKGDAKVGKATKAAKMMAEHRSAVLNNLLETFGVSDE